MMPSFSCTRTLYTVTRICLVSLYSGWSWTFVVTLLPASFLSSFSEDIPIRKISPAEFPAWDACWFQKLLKGVFHYSRQSLVPQACDYIGQSLWFSFRNRFRNGKYLRTFEVGSIIPDTPFYTILSFSFLLPRRLALLVLLVFSVLVGCPGARISDMFGKPVVMAIQMLALRIPLPASFVGFSGISLRGSSGWKWCLPP